MSNRLFIADNKLFGSVNSSQYLLDTNKIKNVDPPNSFIKDVLSHNRYKYCVIDVALINNTINNTMNIVRCHGNIL